MKRETVYKLGIGILLLLNLGLTAVLLLGRRQGPPRPGGDQAARYIIRELQMTETQQQEFARLRQLHQQYIRPLHDSLVACRDRLYSSTAYGDTALARKYTLRMGELHALLDWYTYDHFRQVKAICTAEQQQKFDGIIREALKMMAPGKRPPGDSPGPRPEQ